MKNIIFTILLIFIIFSKSSSQSITKPFILTYNDGSIIEGQMPSQDFESILKGISVTIDNKKVEVPLRNISSLVINDNEKYVVINDQVLKVLEEGDITMYTDKEGWIYLKKLNEATQRLENHYSLIEDGTVVKIDTVKEEKNRQVGIWKLKRDYFYTVSKLLIDKEYPAPPKMKLAVNNIKKQVIKYNNIQPIIQPKSNFNGGGYMYLYGGYRSFVTPSNDRFGSADYYLEFGDAYKFKRFSIYVSFRPDFITNKNDNIRSEFGIRVKIITENKFEPFIKVGSTLALKFRLDESSDLIKFGGGLRYHINSRFGVEAAIINNSVSSFSVGLVGKLR